MLTHKGEIDASSHGKRSRSPFHMLLCTKRRRRGRMSKTTFELVAHPSFATLIE
jgi:hypothetical protein